MHRLFSGDPCAGAGSGLVPCVGSRYFLYRGETSSRFHLPSDRLRSRFDEPAAFVRR
jgi:hypothetical protein